MLIVDKRCSDICCDEFSMPQIDRKINNQKTSDTKKFICSGYGEIHPILSTGISKFVDEQQS